MTNLFKFNNKSDAGTGINPIRQCVGDCFSNCMGKCTARCVASCHTDCGWRGEEGITRG